MEEMHAVERARMIVCLNKGIIPIDLTLNEELAKMDPEEARIAKRKFRKLRRKAEKQFRFMKFRSHRLKRAVDKVHKDIRAEANALLRGETAPSGK